MASTELDDIINNLIDNLELLRLSGIRDISCPAGDREPASAPPVASVNITSQSMAEAKASGPLELTFIEGPDRPLSSLSLAGPGKRTVALRAWRPDERIIFIRGEDASGMEELFTGPNAGQMALVVNWMAGLLKTPLFDEMPVSTCLASGVISEKGQEGEAYKACWERLKASVSQTHPGIIVAFGKEACTAIIGSADVKRLRGRLHLIDKTKVFGTWGPDDLLRDASLKKETKVDMLMVIEEAGKRQ